MSKKEKKQVSKEQRNEVSKLLKDIPSIKDVREKQKAFACVHTKLYERYKNNVPERIHINFLKNHLNTTIIVRRASLLEVFVKYLYYRLFRPNYKIDYLITTESYTYEDYEDCTPAVEFLYYSVLKDLLSNRFVEKTILNNIKFFLRKNNIEVARIFASRFANEYVIFYEDRNLCLMPRRIAYVDLYPDETVTQVAIF